MCSYARFMLTTLVATAALAGLISSASSRTISVTNQNFRTTWSSFEFAALGAATVRCAVTLEGSFHARTIAKVIGGLIGYVTRGAIRRPCTGGTAWFFNGVEVYEPDGSTLPSTLPWHREYEGFAGTLPNMTRLILSAIGMRYRVRAPFFGIPISCDYTSSSGERAIDTITRNTITGIIDNTVVSGSIRSSTGGCPTGQLASIESDGRITLLGNTTRITVTLI
jgi:hypothetical protein